jgi:hypothetical protein
MNSDENQLFPTWTVKVEIPPRFQANVWAQIAARESSRRPLWDQLRDWVAAEFCKPHLAPALVTLGLTLSIALAYMQAQDTNVMKGKELEARYLETINPLAHMSHST